MTQKVYDMRKPHGKAWKQNCKPKETEVSSKKIKFIFYWADGLNRNSNYGIKFESFISSDPFEFLIIFKHQFQV